MKIRPVGAELFHVDKKTHRWIDRYTHMTKLIVAFRNFANSPKKYQNPLLSGKIIIGN